MKSTKEKIKTVALQLFNRDGLVNVRLQHIADEAIISVGNLAYHYPNKEAIVIAVYDELKEKQGKLLLEYLLVPLFENINHIFHSTIHFQKEYSFFYLDTIEILRAYPILGEKHQELVKSQIQQIITIIEFNRSRGSFEIEESTTISLLAETLWMHIDHWLSSRVILGRSVDNVSDFIESNWNILKPHFSKMGHLEYRQMLDRPYDFYF